MTKPKNNAAINGTHFQFLSPQISSGKFCLSVDEARRFVYIAKELVSCAVWDKKVDPAKIKAIMHEVFVAPNKEDLNVSKVKLF